ncbi:MAG: hypothetical protein AAB222_07895, partial [Candidatus Binatota bacterium]
ALTTKLVELHGGRIWAESEGEGKGSTFTVVMPFEGTVGSGQYAVTNFVPTAFCLLPAIISVSYEASTTLIFSLPMSSRISICRSMSPSRNLMWVTSAGN